MKGKVYTTILLMVLYILGFFGLLSHVLVRSHIGMDQMDISYDQEGAHDRLEAVVDGHDNIYMASLQRPKIQVFDPQGHFEYAFEFAYGRKPSSYYVDKNDTLHILFERPQSIWKIKDKTIIYQSSLIDDQDRQAFLKGRKPYEGGVVVEKKRLPLNNNIYLVLIFLSGGGLLVLYWRQIQGCKEKILGGK